MENLPKKGSNFLKQKLYQKPRYQSEDSDRFIKQRLNNSVSNTVIEHRRCNQTANNCPLNDLPPVSEAEHGIHKCFCHLCTCNQHKCPTDYDRARKAVASAFRSEYRKEYRRKGSGQLSAPNVKQIRGMTWHSKQPIDFLTTKNQDYQAWKIQKVQPCRATSQFRNGYQLPSDIASFQAQSDYRMKYQDWKQPAGVVQIVKGQGAKYNPSSIKLDTRTSYSTTHGNVQQDSCFNSKLLKPQNNAMPFLNTNSPFNAQSTAQREFKAFSRENFAQRFRNPNMSLGSLHCMSGHYNTTYRHDYVQKAVQKLPLRRRDVEDKPDKLNYSAFCQLLKNSFLLTDLLPSA